MTLFALLLVGLALLGRAAPAEARPAAEGGRAGLVLLDADTVALGRIEGWQERRVPFRFRNEGPAPAAIRELQPGCSCLRGEVERWRAAPGEETAVTLVLSPLRVSGEFRRSLWVVLDDAAGTRVPLTLTGVSPPLVTGLPDGPLELEADAPGATWTRRFALAVTAPGCRLGEPRVESGLGLRLRAALAAEASRGSARELVLEAEALTLGRSRAAVLLPVEGLTNLPPLRLEVRVRAGRALAVSPARLELRLRGGEGALTHKLLVRTEEPEARPEALAWEPRDEGLRVSAVPAKQASSLLVTLHVAPEASGRLRAQGAGVLRFRYPGHAPAEVCLADGDAVRLELFYSPGCPECERVEREVLPELEAWYGGLYELVRHDMTRAETIPLLLAYQQRCGNADNGRVSLVVDGTAFLAGYRVLATGLLDRVAEALDRRVTRQAGAPLAETAPSGEAALRLVRARAEAITLSVVVFGGLVDGINPCATSTLIFFMSVLAVARASRRTRLLVGIAFITASFAVYTALGLGFLYAARHIPEFPLVRRGVEVALGLCMLPLALLSVRDALRFRASGRPEDVTLQIPKRIKARIHLFMRSRLGAGGTILGGLITGAGVTVLESVCTGQSYAPVLAYLIKEGGSELRLWCLLLVYNLLFVLPLAAVFLCFHRGAQLAALVAWSRRHLVTAKLLLALFFALMAALLLCPK